MSAVSLKGTPTVKPQKLTLTKKGNKFIAKWADPPSNWTKDTNEYRVQRVDAAWQFNRAGLTKKQKQKQKHISVWPKVNKKAKQYYKWGKFAWFIDVHGMKLANKTDQVYPRNKFYPKGKWKLANVLFGVVFVNDKGVPPDKYWRWAKHTFKQPADPKSLKKSIENNATTMKVTITLEGKDDKKERYDTEVWWERRDSANRKNAYSKKWVRYDKKETSTNDSFSSSRHLGDLARLPYDQWVKMKCYARTRGIRGDCKHDKSVEHTFSQPAIPTLSKITVNKQYSTVNDASRMVLITASSNSTSNHPVDSFYLQRCKDSEYTSAADVGYYGNWSNVPGASGGSSCGGFSDAIADAQSEPGKHTWYRVVTEHDNYINYSAPVEATDLYISPPPLNPPTQDKAAILSVTSMPDGTSLKVILGAKNDASEATEVSWSVDKNAWESTDGAQTHLVDWYDDKKQSIAGKDYDKTSTLYINGLEEGVPYYIKARRYDEDEGRYGTYATAPSSQYPIRPVTTPTNVQLSSIDYIEREKDIQLSWTYGGVSDQKHWRVEGKLSEDGSWLELMAGDDSMGSRKLPYSTILAVLNTEKPEKVLLRAAVSTGSEFAYSPERTVSFADPPTIKASIDSIVTEQPATMYFTSEAGNLDIIAKITATMGGIADQNPLGDVDQFDGDGIWSDRFSPDWATETADGIHARYVLPENIDFIDTCRYRMEVTAVDRTTGLSSEKVEQVFTIAWSHQAHPPASSSRIMTMPDSKSVAIYPEPPDNYEMGDICDIYRMTPDGGDLVASSVEFGGSAIDKFAPFSKGIVTYYRLCTRTRDGDESWIDIPYSIPGYKIRIDWGNDRYVEYPYNVAFSDTYNKDSEIRSHMDGENVAYLNENVSHTASLSTDLIRLDEPEQKLLTKELANYPGTAFVRLPDGSAYEAVVNVSNMSNSYDSLVVPVTLDATAVTLTDRFKVSTQDIQGSESGGSILPTTFASSLLYWGTDRQLNGSMYNISDRPATPVTVKYATSNDNYQVAYILNSTVAQAPPTTYEDYEFSKDVIWSDRHWDLISSGDSWIEYSDDGVPVAEYSTEAEIAEAYKEGYTSVHTFTNSSGNDMMVPMDDYSVLFYAGSTLIEEQPEIEYVTDLVKAYELSRENSVIVQMVHGEEYEPIVPDDQEYVVFEMSKETVYDYEYSQDPSVVDGVTYYDYDYDTEQYVEVTPQEDDSPLQNGWFIRNERIVSPNPTASNAYELAYEYFLSSDTQAVGSKTYYQKVDLDAYEEVANPESNPVENGYFERTQRYVYTLDTVVQDGKTYYKLNINPSELGWYEDTDTGYSVTQDQEVSPIKVYYKEKIYAIDPPPINDPMDLGYYEKINGEYVLSHDRVSLPGKMYFQKGSLIESGASKVVIAMTDEMYQSLFGFETPNVRFVYAMAEDPQTVITVSGIPDLDVPTGTVYRITASYRVASEG